MKRSLIAPVALVGACAACCALPLLPGFLAGLLTASVGVAFGSWKLGLELALALALLGSALALLLRAKKTRYPSAKRCQVECVTPRASEPCACQLKQKQ